MLLSVCVSLVQLALLNHEISSQHDPRFRPLTRSKRYLGLQKHYKINRRYQECIAPGDVPGHCKHAAFCEMNVLGYSKGSLDYLCVITEMHVGVCCPDDVLISKLTGSRIVMDLPAGVRDYDDDEELSTSGCGITSSSSRRTSEKQSRQWPWLAALYRPGDTQFSFCGGAVITDRHILTAAHCIHSASKDNIRVRLGEYNFMQVGETRARDFGVKDITEHKEYDPATYLHDIAIVTLDKPTVFDTYIWPICLPPMNGSYVNETVIIAGWGQESYSGPTSAILREVAVPVWEQEKCVESFTQRITENNLCAAAYEGGKDSCLGDSGCPLLYKLDNGRWATIGIVSWGIGCGNKDQPGIYTRVDKYIPWIVTHTIGEQIISLP
ncbi:hypothetical protein PPYR_05340 [Photinus pyralis]|uniref:Phenoloxidase-activating factor 2 n=2 Tax=Photinus pyralis TaxID=7054 RepID=A0A5N4AUJ3_PHOPY|nr:proclotting enzyme-like [Photinus pyralis]KAB0800986.1 hypothetical protein PPYR_05340 [Photinus pyralis]